MKTTPHPLHLPPLFLRWTHLLTLILITTGIASLRAAPVAVNNFSFEAPVLGSGGWTNNLLDPLLGPTDPQWIGRNGNGNGDSFIEYIGGFRSEGNQHIGMQNAYFIFQNLGIPFAANTTYRLTVGVGYRNAGQSGALSTSVIGLTVLDEPPSDANFLPGTNTDDQLAIDEVLAASSTSVDSVALNAATQLRFTDVTTEYTTGATPPVGNIVIFLGDAADGVRSHFDNVRLEAVSALDPDGDGIPSEWETAVDRGVPRNLDPAVNDGALDFDTDTLTNFMEFEKGTHPRLADTDADGLNDNLETITDPLNPDGDGDTLLDGAEVTAGTNPNDTDTDDDDFEDQAEVAAGTNPLAADSKPTNNGEILLGINFVGGNATSTGAEVTSGAGSLVQTSWNNAPGGSGGPINILNSAGAASIIRVDWKTNGPAIVGVEPPVDDGNARLMHGILRPRGTAPVPGGDDIVTEITVRNIAYPTYDLYLYLNSEAGGQAIFTANDRTITVANILTYTGSFVQVSGDGGEGNMLLIPNLSGSTLSITQTIESGGIAGLQIVRATTDGDGDGMPNLWEDANGLDKTNPADAALDGDTDGSNNLQEFQRITDPRNPDSDGDTLKDGVETKTGTFVNATNTGTDPLKRDSDADGLADAVETGTGTFVNADNTGSDPNKVDTDGDAFSDGDEVTLGSDPTLAASTPPLPTPIGYWPFNDQGAVETADASGNGNVGTVVGGLTYAPGQTGQAGDFAAQFNGTDAAVTTSSLLSNREAFTMSGWVNFTEPQANRTGWFGQNDAVEFGMSDLDTIELWTPTGGGMNPAFGPSSDGWAHIAVVADATGRRIFINGVLAASGVVGTPTADNTSTFNIGGAGVQDASGNFFNGQIDDVAVWDIALPLTFIEKLADGSLNPGGTAPPAQGDFAISTVTFNTTTQQMTITFPTTPGLRYAVFKRDSTTNNQWLEIHDFVATTEVGNHVIPIPAGITPVLVRVERSQN